MTGRSIGLTVEWRRIYTTLSIYERTCILSTAELLRCGRTAGLPQQRLVQPDEEHRRRLRSAVVLRHLGRLRQQRQKPEPDSLYRNMERRESVSDRRHLVSNVQQTEKFHSQHSGIFFIYDILPSGLQPEFGFIRAALAYRNKFVISCDRLMGETRLSSF